MKGSRRGSLSRREQSTGQKGTPTYQERPSAGPEYEGPDFVDERDIRELMGEEDDDEEREDYLDEGEMNRVVMGRIGGWVDWAVGWMDVRGDESLEDEEDAGEETEGQVTGGAIDIGEIERRLALREAEDGIDGDGEEAVEIGPPPGEGGWVGDAKWLFGVAKRIAL